MNNIYSITVGHASSIQASSFWGSIHVTHTCSFDVWFSTLRVIWLQGPTEHEYQWESLVTFVLIAWCQSTYGYWDVSFPWHCGVWYWSTATVFVFCRLRSPQGCFANLQTKRRENMLITVALSPFSVTVLSTKDWFADLWWTFSLGRPCPQCFADLLRSVTGRPCPQIDNNKHRGVFYQYQPGGTAWMESSSSCFVWFTHMLTHKLRLNHPQHVHMGSFLPAAEMWSPLLHQAARGQEQYVCK